LGNSFTISAIGGVVVYLQLP